MNLDELLSETAHVPDPSPAVLAAAAPNVVPLRRGRRRAVIIGLTAAAASLALVIPTIGVDGVNGGKPAAAANASAVLLKAGRAAGAQPGGAADASYWHSVSTYTRGGGAAIRREIWIGHTEIGVLRDGGVDSGILPLEVAYFPYGEKGVTWDGLYALPTESHALETGMRAGFAHDPKGRDTNDRIFVNIGDLLRESPASPALRKALYEIAARLPGVTLVGDVTDGAGRHGVAVERGGERLVIDPSDGRLLEESQTSALTQTVNVTTGETQIVGDGTWKSTYLEQGPTETAPAVTNRGLKKQ